MKIWNPHKTLFPIAIKTLFAVLILILAYLFALKDDGYYFDKWTKSIVKISRYKTIE